MIDKSISCKLKNWQQLQNAGVVVSIVSKTIYFFRQAVFLSPGVQWITCKSLYKYHHFGCSYIHIIPDFVIHKWAVVKV